MEKRANKNEDLHWSHFNVVDDDVCIPLETAWTYFAGGKRRQEAEAIEPPITIDK